MYKPKAHPALFNHFNLLNAKCILFLAFFSFILLFSGCKKDFTPQPIATSSDNNVQAAVSGKTNIILIVANDFGFELPTYNGGQSYSTPELDYLAANGMLFQQAYNHPDGSPSRMAIITGKYNFRNYVRWGYLPPGEKTIGNMLKNAGYSTCWVGKWQLNGADKRIRSAGFDNYIVYLPKGVGQRVNRYKDPKLYENGDYLPDSVTKGQYSEDMMFDYLSNFIDSNKTKPFFAVYATLLPAQPWVPTPDDPAYPTWNSKNDGTLDDKKYFPGMVSYLDKVVGKIRKKLEEEGLASNTVIMFTSATQTDSRITSLWNGQSIAGTKTTTNKLGTNIPLLAYWPGTVAAGKRSSTLVDFTDFLPTMANIAGTPVPKKWGTLDGTTFYDNLITDTGTKNRRWVFCHWDNNPTDASVPPERFINDTIYKLYDTVGEGNGKFYNISVDPTEQHPIPDNQLNAIEKQRKLYFRSILDTMHN